MPFFQLILSTRKSDFRAFDPLLALFGRVHSEWVTVENESDCKRPKSSAAVREVNIIIIRILQKKIYIIRQIDHCYPTHERSFLYKYKY